MEAGKVIENILIFGGIGTIAYMLLKKKLPTKESCDYDQKYLEAQNTKIIFAQAKKVSSEQIKQLQADYDIVKTRYDRSNCKLVALKKANPAGANIIPEFTSTNCKIDPKDMFNVPIREKYDDCIENYKKNSDVWKPLIDPIVYTGSRDYKEITDPRIKESYKWYSCGNIDKWIAQNKQLIIDKYKNKNSSVRIPLEAETTTLEADFKKFNCRDKIEAERTKDLIALQSKGSIKAEESIVTKGFAEQKTYIILGALVLLTGFYVVVKK